MAKYVVINNGTNAFYDDAIHSAIPDGALEISDKDYKTFFSDNGKYIFKIVDSKAVLSEITYTAEEIKQQKLNSLDYEYQSQFDSLVSSLGLAILSGDTDTQDSIKSDYAALKTEYTTKREAIENGIN